MEKRNPIKIVGRYGIMRNLLQDSSLGRLMKIMKKYLQTCIKIIYLKRACILAKRNRPFINYLKEYFSYDVIVV